MEISRRGVPPYTVWSAGFTGCPEGHPGVRHPMFRSAVADIYDLTDGGNMGFGVDGIMPARMIDGNNETVFSMDNSVDVQFLDEIGQSGVVYLRVSGEN